MPRPSGRAADAMREVRLEPNAAKYAEGSCLAAFGETRVLCCATVEDKPPPFLRNTGRGWVTAEYGMLPRSTPPPTPGPPGAAGGRRNTACCPARPTPAPTARPRAAARPAAPTRSNA